MPSLRERKRYLAFEIISDRQIADKGLIASAIASKTRELVGSIGLAKAGLIFIKEKYDAQQGKGMFRVSNTSVDLLRASLAMVDNIAGQPVIVRSLGVSGMISTAESRYVTLKGGS